MKKGTEIPGYLKKDWGKSRGRRVIRFRLENEMRVGIGKKSRQCCADCVEEGGRPGSIRGRVVGRDGVAGRWRWDKWWGRKERESSG